MNTQAWTVAFLLDQQPPTRILFLQRSASREFAPNKFTGIGGHIEPGESPDAAAYRELAEEAGVTGVNLTEFARVIIDNHKFLHYYWGILSSSQPPECNEGTLSWIPLSQVLNQDIISTTYFMCQEWQNRKFSTDQPYTIWLETTGEPPVSKLVRIVNDLV